MKKLVYGKQQDNKILKEQLESLVGLQEVILNSEKARGHERVEEIDEELKDLNKQAEQLLNKYRELVNEREQVVEVIENLDKEQEVENNIEKQEPKKDSEVEEYGIDKGEVDISDLGFDFDRAIQEVLEADIDKLDYIKSIHHWKDVKQPLKFLDNVIYKLNGYSIDLDHYLQQVVRENKIEALSLVSERVHLLNRRREVKGKIEFLNSIKIYKSMLHKGSSRESLQKQLNYIKNGLVRIPKYAPRFDKSLRDIINKHSRSQKQSILEPLS